MVPGLATPRARGFNTNEQAAVADINLAAHQASTENDNDVYIHVPREGVGPVNTGLTETVHHHVRQGTKQVEANPVLLSVLVQLLARASQQCGWIFITILCKRLSILHQPGLDGSTSVEAVSTEPPCEPFEHHIAGLLVVPAA